MELSKDQFAAAVGIIKDNAGPNNKMTFSNAAHRQITIFVVDLTSDQTAQESGASAEGEKSKVIERAIWGSVGLPGQGSGTPVPLAVMHEEDSKIFIDPKELWGDKDALVSMLSNLEEYIV